MQNSRLSGRERVLLALAHQETDRIPIAMVCSDINEPARSEFGEYVRGKGRGDLETYLDALLDITTVTPSYNGPRLEPGGDIWGVKRKPAQYGIGSYDEIDYYPLADAESMDRLAQRPWPSADWYDYSVLPERIAAAHAGGERCIMVSNGNIFETSWYMRGFERMFMDLAINPELAHGIMGRVTDFYVEYFRRILTAAKGEVDLVFTADDIGGQNGLLMSPDMWERFIKPYHARLNAAIHEHGARVIYHSDGGIMDAVPGLIDMKIDVLQALQFDAAGMDAVELKAAYGGRLSFQGGVSVQQTLPFGTPDQVREEVEYLISTLGRNGGYILGPSHYIQAGTPPENIYAMFETARSFYPHCRTARTSAGPRRLSARVSPDISWSSPKGRNQTVAAARLVRRSTLCEDGRAPRMLPEIFVSDLQTGLASADAAARTRLFKEALRRSFAALPPIVDELRNGDSAVAPATALTYADHLVAQRLPLADGTARDCAEPYDWYCERGESSAEKSPALMPQRMEFMGTLVSAYRQTGDDRYVRSAHDYIMDYVSRHWTAPGDMPPKECWLDVSIRVGQWHHMHLHGGIYTALREWHDHPAFSGDDFVLIFRAITHMMNALLPEMALGSNWRTSQLTGIFTQGLCYPFLEDAALWLETGVNGINEEFEAQFLDDGSHEELSVGYGAGVWSLFVRYFALSREAPQLGLRFDPKRLEKIQEYYLGSLKPFGKSAGFGDVWAIRDDAELRPDSRPHAGRADGQSNRWESVRANAELAQRYEDFPSGRFILGGKPAPSWTTRFNRSSGYLYMRNGWSPGSLYMNCNMGYYANCHCHYGLLGIEAAGFGREFIVDPGNSDYSGRPINANFRNTRAHSTMTVDGLNQSADSPVFVSRLTVGNEYDFAVGAYRGGYLHGSPFNSWEGGLSAAHFRHILFVKDSYWVVLDAMTTHPDHTVETRFQLMPARLHPIPGGGYRTGYEQGNLALIPLAWDGWEHGIHEGEENPIEGWLPAPGHRFVPAPVYKAVRQSSGHADWHGTLLFPYRQAELPQVAIRRIEVGPIGFGFEIETDAWTDVLFVSNSWMPRHYRIGGVESDAPLCHQRFVNGKPVYGYTCEGNFLTVDGQDVFRQPGSLLAREFEYGATIKTETTQPRYSNR